MFYVIDKNNNIIGICSEIPDLFTVKYSIAEIPNISDIGTEFIEVTENENTL